MSKSRPQNNAETERIAQMGAAIRPLLLTADGSAKFCICVPFGR